jgi:hypothetical protein
MSGKKLLVAGVAGAYGVYLARRFSKFKSAGLFTPSTVSIAPKVPDSLPSQIMYTVINSFPFGSLKTAPPEPPARPAALAPDLLGPINWEVSPVGNRQDR